MSAAVVDVTKVMRGRLVAFSLLTAAAAEVINIDKVKDGIVEVSEEIISQTYETVSAGVEITTNTERKLVIDFEYDELDGTDIAAILTAADIVLTTAAGGANGTGQTFTVVDVDVIQAYVVGLKTHVHAEKKTPLATLPYTIADVAAA